MEIRFDNKVALVTGASSGIGSATALELAKSGARVVVHYNNRQEEAMDMVKKIRSMGNKALAIKANVSYKEDVEELVAETLKEFGTIDILVNNAGAIIKRMNLEQMEEALWDEVMDVNLKSIYLMTQAVIPSMKKKHYGRIINVTSVAARTGGSIGTGPYSSAKGGALTLTKNMAKELAPYNIIVNAVSPGIIVTPFHEGNTPPDIFERFKENVILKRGGTAEECAWLILFLASDYVTYIVGETIEINGGLLMD
ncbi:MAG: 3-oxoacyl-ACP reductase family protein [Cyclobacteriaceae bacterium]